MPLCMKKRREGQGLELLNRASKQGAGFNIAPMTMEQPTRREILKGMAAASLIPAKLQAETSASPLCFTSAVEMAQLIRAKKLSAREALAEHLKQIECVNSKVNAIVTLVPAMAGRTDWSHR